MEAMSETNTSTTREVRALATVTTAVLGTALVVHTITPGAAIGLIAGQFYVFMRVWTTRRPHPYRHVAALIRRFFPEGELEHPLPQRFAALIGSIVTAASLLFFLAGRMELALSFTLMATAAAGANAFAGWCAACVLYPRVRRMVDPLLSR